MMRKFALYPKPHVADPAWIEPVVELVGGSFVTSSLTTVRDIVWEMQHELGRQQGLNEANTRWRSYLKSIGWDDNDLKDALLWRP